MQKPKKFFILSRKWSSNRGNMTSVERFCNLIDNDFNDYHGKIAPLNYRISQILKNNSSSAKTENGTAYNSNSVKLELYGIFQSIKLKSKVIFYPYADYDYNFIGYLKKILNIKIVLWSFFSVEELTTRFKNLDHFNRADLILVAGREQYNFLKSKLTNPKLVYFPIGVDTNFFKPKANYNKYQIVFSGANRRDFETAIKAFDIVYEKHKELKVIFIGCYKAKEKIKPRNYITICEHLDDKEMLEIYQNSHLQVLTLYDGGSSNSLLEGYACGIPVICTNLSNIQDYIINDEILKVKQNDYLSLSNKIINIFIDDEVRNKLSRECFEKAREYDWLTIKDKFEIEIKNLIKQ